MSRVRTRTERLRVSPLDKKLDSLRFGALCDSGACRKNTKRSVKGIGELYPLIESTFCVPESGINFPDFPLPVTLLDKSLGPKFPKNLLVRHVSIFVSQRES